MTISEAIFALIQDEQIRQEGRFTPQDQEYLEKIDRHAELITHHEQGEIFGYVFFYCNDPAKQFSYITLIGTSQAARGKGIGFGLLQAVLAISRARGFRSCRLEVRKENNAALNFYQRAGFQSIEDRGDKLLMDIDIQ